MFVSHDKQKVIKQEKDNTIYKVRLDRVRLGLGFSILWYNLVYREMRQNGQVNMIF